MFTLNRDGTGLLMKGPWGHIVWTSVTAAAGLAALGAGLTGWLIVKTNGVERILLLVAGLVLVYPSLPHDVIGFSLFGAALAIQHLRRRPAQRDRRA
jgi:TRAP-type uncharacterized transport system fused permease subunit